MQLPASLHERALRRNLPAPSRFLPASSQSLPPSISSLGSRPCLRAAASKSSSMDRVPPHSSRRSTSGNGGKARGGSRRGMKMSTLRAPASSPSPPPSSSPVSTPTPPPPTSAPAPPPATSSISAPGVLISSPAASTMPPRPSQGPGWGAVPPTIPSQLGNQQTPNPWGYPPSGFLNFIQQPHYPQMQGENFHLVGQALNFNPISPPPPPPSAYTTGTSQAMQQGNSMNGPAIIDIDKEDNSEANREVKKRYWSHEEEERLASAWLNASKDPVKGNDKKFDSF